LNPGYDPALPLYRPWPMFDAIRDANTGNTASRWAQRPLQSATPTSTATGSTNLVVSFLPDNAARLAQELNRAGIKMTPFSANDRTDFLIVDGSAVLSAEASDTLKNAAQDVLAHGGTVWIWNLQPEGAKTLTQALEREIIVEPRIASSFIVKKDSPLTAGLDNAGLYFSEGDDWQQMSYGLGGEFIDHANVLLEACPADWRQWNYKGEPVKTGALYRSEVENTAPRAVLVTCPLEQGRLILCNLSPEIKSTHKLAVLQQLFRNAGIQPEQVTDADGFTDLNGRLVCALVCGSFGVEDSRDAYSEKLPVGDVTNGTTWNGKKWRVANASDDGVFDFKKGLVRGPQDNAYAYLAVWIKSPQPLNDLLSEPNLPKLTFTYGSDDGCQVWLNGELLATHDRIGPIDPDAFTLNPLLLKLGWNQLVIKVVQASGEWKFTGRFGCTDVNLLAKLEFSTEKPVGK
jgi:beta-galactosidase